MHYLTQHLSQLGAAGFLRELRTLEGPPGIAGAPGFSPFRKLIDQLVIESLEGIRTLIDSDTDPPMAMLSLRKIAEAESGWLDVIQSMIEVIPIEDAFGPANIILLLDEFPIPIAETWGKFVKILALPEIVKLKGDAKILRKRRNAAIVLGYLAEKLAGPRSQELFTSEVLDYLIASLDPDFADPEVILFSVIALEKFAQTAENKSTISKRLNQTSEEPSAQECKESKHPLLRLENFISNDGGQNSKLEDKLLIKRQIGFCARWSLDNLFLAPDRRFSYLTTDNARINVMLNDKDVSEYLKLSTDGLEARSDASSFESVRATFSVFEGVWFYEATIVTPGIMQIGWATKRSKYLNYEGYGVGDDEHSVAIDCCRKLLWFGANCEDISTQLKGRCWGAGDVIGSLLDFDNKKVVFYFNGDPVGENPHTKLFESESVMKDGVFAGASFMSFQQCVFNFGATPWKFPPKDVGKFSSCNEIADNLTPDDKIILPRHLKLQKLREVSVSDDACTLCFDAVAVVRILPCAHEGFCDSCAHMLDNCPLCRGPIEEIEKIKDQSNNDGS